MNFKRILGSIILILGCLMIAFGFYVKHRVGQVKEVIHETASPFSSHPIGKALGGAVEQKAKQYDPLILFSFIGGSILVIVGGVIVYLSKRQ